MNSIMLCLFILFVLFYGFRGVALLALLVILSSWAFFLGLYYVFGIYIGY